MKKIKFLTVFCLLFLANSAFAQNLSSDYKVISVNKTVREIAYDEPYTSPLENYIARIHSWIEGKYAPIYSEMIDAGVRQSANKPYPAGAAENLLSSKIEQIVIYKDSIGLVFLKEKSEPNYYLVGFSQFENGKWLGTGDDLCYEKEKTKYIENKSIFDLNKLRQYYRQQIVSTDTLAFVNYLKQNGKEPVSFLINSLKNHKIVMYGEQHFRPNSWNLLNKLIQSPDFANETGAVFLELSIDAQPYLDEYFNNVIKDTNLIFDIFQKEEILGWLDRGMYSFLVNMWDINSKLPNEKKIKVFAADFPRPFYHNITTLEQYKELTKESDRNECMAQTVENYLNSANDKRNCLFIVGSGHAYKSDALTRGGWLISGKSAANILCAKFGKDFIFTICTHAPIISNNGIIFGQTRKGLFDWVFAENGNIPVAFDFKDSPFGKEPYDVDANIRFDAAVGSYEDNFDGYIFLQPLKDELASTTLFELFTDKFIEEIKRRANILNSEDEILPGIKLKELDRQTLIEKLKLEGTKKRWKFPE